MQAYGKAFAKIYNLRWGGFAKWAAPLLLDFYTGTSIGQENKEVLDLCCGTGQLALHFLEQGYRVTGLDLSEHMLRYARENCQASIESGQAEFIQGDASDFQLEKRFGLVVSTFDALNHLESKEALQKCFICVQAVCEGYFIFDLNTKKGLRRWNGINIDDSSEEILIINRGIYDGESDRAWTRITGFVQGEDGRYERFDETAFNTVFEMEEVRGMLLEAGWRTAYCAKVEDLKTAIEAPEEEGRVFFVAGR